MLGYIDDGSEAALGHVIRVFKPIRGNAVAGVILGFLLITVGVLFGWRCCSIIAETGAQMPLWQNQGNSWGGFALTLAIALTGLIGGPLLIRYSIGLISYRLEFRVNGLSILDKSRIDVVFWQSITRICETHILERAGPRFIPRDLRRVTRRTPRFEIFTIHSERPITVSHNKVAHIVAFGRMLRAEMDTRGIKWTNAEAEAVLN